MNFKLIRQFPCSSIHSGAALGNGRLGILLWGEKNRVILTIGGADIWDHRGGLAWTPEQNFADLRQALEAHDADKVKKMFASNSKAPVKSPSLLSVGRLLITLPETAQLVRYEQRLDMGLTQIIYVQSDVEHSLELCCDMSCQFGLAVRGLTEQMQLQLIPAMNLSAPSYSKYLGRGNRSIRDRGLEEPETYDSSDTLAFVQKRPADPAFGVVVKRKNNELHLALHNQVADLAELLNLPLPLYAKVYQSSVAWWKDFWANTAKISLDHADLEEIYALGMYKYGIMTNPAGVPPGLQGPWIEDCHLPPWSGDYHFNINVQMCHAPGLKAGCFANLKMLFDLVLSWRDKLRYNAQCFAGIPDGYMLPHAVDDRATCMGAFWTGCIDQACAAWIAQMMYDYCDYSGDWDYLRDQVFDFMAGVMRVFQVMIERQSDGTLALPVSISPEYNNAQMNAWGRNSSFQLAAIHSLARNLLKAAQILQFTPEPFWSEVVEKLPQFSQSTQNNIPKIALWDGQELEFSHRHHSHLGGICPFGTLDVDAPELQEVLKNSIEQWIELGKGIWTGWCVPWAAQIYTRLHESETAVFLLEMWKKAFTTAGGSPLHDCRIPGLTLFTQKPHETMQIDGAMGAVTAIQDLLVHDQGGKIKFFYGVPPQWANAQFENMCLPGGLRASGVWHQGQTQQLIFHATRDYELTFCTADCPQLCQLELAQNQTVKLTLESGCWHKEYC